VSAISVRINAEAHKNPRFAYYEVYASQTNHALGDVVDEAEFNDFAKASRFFIPDVVAGETWYVWGRPTYDDGETAGTLVALGNLTVTGDGGLADHSVTYAKIQVVGARKLLGSIAGGTVEEIAFSTDGAFTANSDDLVPSQKAIGTKIAAAIAALVASSPSTLDTLNEIAAALGNDPAFSTTILTALGKRLRFDAVQSLSSGDITQALTNLGIISGLRTFLTAASLGAGRTALGVAIGSDVQAFAAILDAIAALSSTGLIVRTGSGTVAARNLAVSGAGLAVTNGTGVSGNPTIAAADDLAALEALSTTGFAKRTGTSAWSLLTAAAILDDGTSYGRNDNTAGPVAITPPNETWGIIWTTTKMAFYGTAARVVRYEKRSGTLTVKDIIIDTITGPDPVSSCAASGGDVQLSFVVGSGNYNAWRMISLPF
jgi:hypothetical protein